MYGHILPVVTYTATGDNNTYTFPFDYLRKAFVFVEIDGKPVSNFVLEGKTIYLDDTPTKDSVIKIYRSTQTKPITSWADASVLKAKDLNIHFTQTMHIIEEMASNGWLNFDLSSFNNDVGFVTRDEVADLVPKDDIPSSVLYVDKEGYICCKGEE